MELHIPFGIRPNKMYSRFELLLPSQVPDPLASRVIIQELITEL